MGREEKNTKTSMKLKNDKKKRNSVQQAEMEFDIFSILHNNFLHVESDDDYDDLQPKDVITLLTWRELMISKRVNEDEDDDFRIKQDETRKKFQISNSFPCVLTNFFHTIIFARRGELFGSKTKLVEALDKQNEGKKVEGNYLNFHHVCLYIFYFFDSAPQRRFIISLSA